MQVPGRPHLTQPYEAVLEALGAIGATEAISLVQPFLEHPVPTITMLRGQSYVPTDTRFSYGELLVKMLDNSDLKLRRVVLGDLGAIGYLAAAEAIAQAKVENSFKLIALKGLLEYQLPDDLDALVFLIMPFG